MRDVDAAGLYASLVAATIAVTSALSGRERVRCPGRAACSQGQLGSAIIRSRSRRTLRRDVDDARRTGTTFLTASRWPRGCHRLTPHLAYRSRDLPVLVRIDLIPGRCALRGSTTHSGASSRYRLRWSRDERARRRGRLRRGAAGSRGPTCVEAYPTTSSIKVRLRSRVLERALGDLATSSIDAVVGIFQ